MALRGRAGAHPGNCGHPVLARSPGCTCSGRSLGGSHTSRASKDCPRHTRSHLRRRRLGSDCADMGGPLFPRWGGISIPWRHRPRGDSHGHYPCLRLGRCRLYAILGATPQPAPFICPRSPALYPIRDPDPGLTAAGPAPLAAVAGLTGNALEAPGFVLAFAIRAGARVSAFVDVCAGGRKTRLGTTWPARHSGSSAGPLSVTEQQGKPAPLGSRTPTSKRL